MNNDTDAAMTGLKQSVATLHQGMGQEGFLRLDRSLAPLEAAWREDVSVRSLVKMVRSLAGYLKSKKASAHPKAIRVLGIIVDQLDHAVSSGQGETGGVARKAAAASALKHFHAFKKELPGRVPSQQTGSERRQTPDLSALKAALLSLEWEISDSGIASLDREISRLVRQWDKTTIYGTFLQMIQSLGKYIGSKRADARRDAISLLHSLFSHLEHIARDSAMNPQEKRQLLRQDIDRFKAVKKAIARDRSIPAQPVHQVLEEETLEFMVEESGGEPIQAIHKSEGPMDYLISTKSDTAAQVDGMIDEIHLFNVFGEDGDPGKTLPGVTGVGGASPPAAQGIKELSPDRRNLKPIPEIEKRLDAFFDEDDALSDFAFVDDGELVVPYGESDESPGAHHEEPEDDRQPDPGDTPAEAAGDGPGPDEIIPYHFDDEIQDDVREESCSQEDSGTDEAGRTELDTLLSGIRSLGPDLADEILDDVEEAAFRLRSFLGDRPADLVCLEMIESITRFARCSKSEAGSDALDLLGVLGDGLEFRAGLRGELTETAVPWLIETFSRYIAFHTARYPLRDIPGDEIISGTPDTDGNDVMDTESPPAGTTDDGDAPGQESTGLDVLDEDVGTGVDSEQGSGEVGEGDQGETVHVTRPKETGLFSGLKSVFRFGKK